MEAGNFIALHDSDDPPSENEGGDNSDKVLVAVDSQGLSSEDKKDDLDNEGENRHWLRGENPEKDLVDSDSEMEVEDLSGVHALTAAGCGFDNNGIQKICNDEDLVDSDVNLTETVAVAAASKTSTDGEISRLAVQEETSIEIKKRGGNTISGVKRARVMFEEDEQQPSVCVKYNFLTRSSKHKLEELLQQWSEWHAQHNSSSQDPPEALESGEETYFPALHIGLAKATSVSFWIDKQTRKQQTDEFVPLDCNSVPLYDRGFALGLTSGGSTSNIEGGLEIVDDAARCFNCGSYNHSLKECPKPRDNAAVNNARKQHKSKRNQNSSSRNPARYYQNSPAGKYDGLRPGALDAETRKLLGLGELDPPPWLSRMREIGYPPGYLDPDDENQPSGITIYADGEVKAEQEDGEIVETDNREPRRKKTVEFPGINGPIPENADERFWTVAPSSSDIHRNRPLRRSNHSTEPTSRSHHREERWSIESRDDGPPGVDMGFGPATSTFLPRYGSSYDSSYSRNPRLNPSFGRIESDRGRRGRFLDEDYGHGSSHYSSHLSPKEYGSLRSGNWVDESRSNYDFEYNSRERQDRYRHLSRR
ncbi:hypothetical protein TIFTF001_026138 [Ficus carica]|uniref:CCHC-type domain-containing protein n=1 Tax=Ficus carica TaxID=3494 RepID=A0AA88AKC0_FICCA|nr:hypothetical protein TIFTF001_026138 [Ficus carica]